MRRFLCILTAILALSLALPSGQAWSRSSVYVPESGSLFWLDILDEGDVEEGSIFAGSTSQFTLNEGERQALSQGLEYWQLVLQDGAQNTAPLRIVVQTLDRHIGNASAQSYLFMQGVEAGKTLLAGALSNNWFGISGSDWNEALAQITIEKSAANDGLWYTGPMASLPQNGARPQLASVLLHEMGHALGIVSTAQGYSGLGFFGSALTLWDSGLRDINGNAPEPSMFVAPEGSIFADFATEDGDMYCGVYFTGEHVEEVLQNALLSFPEDPTGVRGSYDKEVPGLPVQG